MAAPRIRTTSVHVAPPCKWILHTLHQTMLSTEDPVMIVTLLAYILNFDDAFSVINRPAWRLRCIKETVKFVTDVIM